MVTDSRYGSLGEPGPPSPLATTQVPAALRRLLEQLTGILPITGCWATLLEEPSGDPRSVAAAEPVARRLQALEDREGTGPSLHAARTGEQVLLGDLDAPDAVERFPRFVRGAVAAGVAAVYRASRSAPPVGGSVP